MPANLTGLNVTLPKHPSWTVKLGHGSHHCTSVMLTSPRLRKWTFVQSTESEAHLRYPFPVIRKCYPFPTAKYQLLYWLEPVELNQGAELCFLTFLKFLKDKQVLSDRRLPLGSALLLKAPSAALWPPRMGPRYSLWYCLCSDLQPLVGQKGHEVTLFLPCFLGFRKLQTLSCSASSRQLYQHPFPYPHSCHF